MTVIESILILYVALGAGLATFGMVMVEGPGILTAWREWPRCAMKLVLTALTWGPIGLADLWRGRRP